VSPVLSLCRIQHTSACQIWRGDLILAALRRTKHLWSCRCPAEDAKKFLRTSDWCWPASSVFCCWPCRLGRLLKAASAQALTPGLRSSSQSFSDPPSLHLRPAIPATRPSLPATSKTPDPATHLVRISPRPRPRTGNFQRRPYSQSLLHKTGGRNATDQAVGLRSFRVGGTTGFLIFWIIMAFFADRLPQALLTRSALLSLSAV